MNMFKKIILVTLTFYLLIRNYYCLYSSKSPVKVLSGNELRSILNEHPVVVVEFFASWCGHCKAFAPEYEKAAMALNKFIPVIAVEDESVMGEYGIKSFPTVKIFSSLFDKPKDYIGQRNTEGITNAAISAIKDVVKIRLKNKTSNQSKPTKNNSKVEKSVVELTDNNFDDLVIKDTKNPWFIKFYAPWCGHCKAMASDWLELAKQTIHHSIKIGKVDATINTLLAQRYKIQGYPTILMFPSGKKTSIQPIPYNGPRSTSDLLEFALKFKNQNIEVIQLLSQDQFDDICNKGLCIIVFLPNIEDSGVLERRKYLEDYKQVIKSSANMPLKFFWSEGGQQFEFEEKLNLAFGYPATIAINLEKQKYAIHRGSFTVQSLNSFILGLMTGKFPVDPLPKHLKLNKIDNPWEDQDNSEEKQSHTDEL